MFIACRYRDQRYHILVKCQGLGLLSLMQHKRRPAAGQASALWAVFCDESAPLHVQSLRRHERFGL